MQYLILIDIIFWFILITFIKLDYRIPILLLHTLFILYFIFIKNLKSNIIIRTVLDLVFVCIICYEYPKYLYIINIYILLVGILNAISFQNKILQTIIISVSVLNGLFFICIKDIILMASSICIFLALFMINEYLTNYIFLNKNTKDDIIKIIYLLIKRYTTEQIVCRTILSKEILIILTFAKDSGYEITVDLIPSIYIKNKTQTLKDLNTMIKLLKIKYFFSENKMFFTKE